MIELHITSGIDSKERACTVVQQNGKSPLRVSIFLDQPFSVSGNRIYVYESVAQVLTNILLGVQLYNFQHSDAEISLNVYAEFTKEETERVDFGMVQTMVNHASKGGHIVTFSEKDTEELSEQEDEGGGFKMKNEYEVRCLSFSEFLNQKSGKSTSFSQEQSLESRRKAKDFAHPVDTKIIQVLDNPLVNSVFSKIINLSTDLDFGLILSTGIRMDNKNGEVKDALFQCSEILGIPVPYTVVSSSVPGMNAYTMGTDGANCIAISSLLKAMMDHSELTFVLGHECGHIALGHVLYHSVMATIRNVSDLIPKIGHSIYQMVAWPLMAWHRRSEISADRAGLLCCGDVQVACRSLMKLEGGFMNLDDINVDEYISDTNQQLRNTVFGRYQELLHEHPILAKRMEALKLFAQSEKYYRLRGIPVPEGMQLLSDSELDSLTEKIIQVMK